MRLETLLTGWHFMRWLRLGLGLMIAFQAVEMHDVWLGLMAVFFLFQAVTNTGCCGASGCAVPTKTTDGKVEDVTYEEIKTK
jgi:hypothetical protein